MFGQGEEDLFAACKGGVFPFGLGRLGGGDGGVDVGGGGRGESGEVVAGCGGETAD